MKNALLAILIAVFCVGCASTKMPKTQQAFISKLNSFNLQSSGLPSGMNDPIKKDSRKVNIETIILEFANYLDTYPRTVKDWVGTIDSIEDGKFRLVYDGDVTLVLDPAKLSTPAIDLREGEAVYFSGDISHRDPTYIISLVRLSSANFSYRQFPFTVKLTDLRRVK